MANKLSDANIRIKILTPNKFRSFTKMFRSVGLAVRYNVQIISALADCPACLGWQGNSVMG